MRQSRQGDRAAVQVSIRATQGLLDRADALVQRADEWPEMGGTVATRSSVLRVALLVGLRTLENRTADAPAADRWTAVPEAEGRSEGAEWRPVVWQTTEAVVKRRALQPAIPSQEAVETVAPAEPAPAKDAEIAQRLEDLRATEWAQALPVAEVGLQLQDLRLWELLALQDAVGNPLCQKVLLQDAAFVRSQKVDRG